jgi:hypothetical protein
MGGGMPGADRKVLPIGKDMNRDKIDGFIDFAIAQPIFPDIGIGDGNGNLRLDRTNESREVGRGHLAAQQHLVADHQAGDDPRIFLGQADRSRNLRKVLQPVAAEPYPLNDFQAHLRGQRRHLVEPIFDRIGAHAIGNLGKLRQILACEEK